ncbi:FxsA family protein [Kordiimonas lipolytica]|uniref:FxsA family protein n=1 Tax=Kordiimonas lipolytica TaxID=1662421 RepID=A0ABV8U675_9PROT
MPLIIFLLILALPVAELAILIDIGEEIGALSTVALCILTAAVGLSIVKRQGIRVFQEMQAASRDGGALGASLVHGFFLAIAGVFLFIPGFMTDFVGALLLIPPVRLALGKLGMAQFVVRRGQARPHETIIIEGEYWEERTEEDAAKARLKEKDHPDNQ